MNETLNKLAGIFGEMVRNHSSFGDIWKNASLGTEAFQIMLSLPDILPGEYETPQEKASLLEQMLGQMNEYDTPRFAIAVREEISRLSPADNGNNEELAMLRDYIDLTLSMEEFCRKYDRHLLFDPVERTAEYEAVFAEVEAEIAGELTDVPRGMGFCFSYWSAKRAALGRRGICWRSPAVMNPNVLFD